RFDGLGCDRKDPCDFLVGSAPGDQIEDLDLAGTEGGQGAFLLQPGTIESEAELNGLDEGLVTEWFCKEIDGAALDRLHRHRNVALSSDEDDWKFPVCCGQLPLKFETALARQAHIEDEAGGGMRWIERQKVGNGPEQLSLQAA